MRSCGIDASAFLGGISGNLGSNFAEGKSEWVVVEADEYDRSFLQLYPEIAVINSIDADHLDIYGSEEGVRESYRSFSTQVKKGGVLLLENHVDMEVPGALRFGTDKGDFRAVNVRAEDGFMVFDLQTKYPGLPTELTALKLPYPGLHNVRNAVAAIASTLLAGGNPWAIADALREFKGAKRRFEVIVRTEKTVYVDDYAHHPAELEATIAAARLMYPGKKITGVFQPHLFSRTRDFADAFAAALDKLDSCLLLPIYPARELPIEGVSSEMLLEKMTLNNRQLVQKSDLLQLIGNSHPEVLVTMGAGDIDTMVEPIKELIKTS
jgi:UDP-N-acetylmuramate--alanine ligase